MDNKKEYILCAAIKRKVPRFVQPYYKGTNDICDIEIGYRHHDIFHRFRDEMMDCDQGFYTSKGRYVDRREAMKIAYIAGQVSKGVALGETFVAEDIESIDKEKFNKLFSEDLY